MLNSVKKLFGGDRAATPEATIRAISAGTFTGRERTVDVVGEASYQHNLAIIAGPKGERSKNEWVKARLIPEPDNKHDKMAVAVRIAELNVGYLTKDGARGYHRALAAAGFPNHSLIDFKARIQGGWRRQENGVVDEGNYGVSIYLPEDLAIHIGLRNG